MLDQLTFIRSVSRNQIHVIARMSKKGFSLRISRTYCVKRVQIKSFFWPAFSSIRTKYGNLLSNSPYSVQIQEIMDQKNSAFGHFSRRDTSLRTIQQVLSLGILNAVVKQTLRFNTASKSLIKWKKSFVSSFPFFTFSQFLVSEVENNTENSQVKVLFLK